MSHSFFRRLRNYYLDVAKTLRGEASVASIFPNTTDIGMSRERIYAEFLRQHVPSKCNVSFGGFVFGDDGSESGQLDIIITTDTTPKFNFGNSDERGKTFSPVEGTIGVASIKSKLDKYELKNALLGIAAIPSTKPLDGRLNMTVSINNYDDWPYKIVYASDGISSETLMTHINDFYRDNQNIPLSRRPNIIHVAGKYVILRADKSISICSSDGTESNPLKIGDYYVLSDFSDLAGISIILYELQVRASASTYILFSYLDLLNKVNNPNA